MQSLYSANSRKRHFLHVHHTYAERRRDGRPTIIHRASFIHFTDEYFTPTQVHDDYDARPKAEPVIVDLEPIEESPVNQTASLSNGCIESEADIKHAGESAIELKQNHNVPRPKAEPPHADPVNNSPSPTEPVIIDLEPSKDLLVNKSQPKHLCQVELREPSPR